MKKTKWIRKLILYALILPVFCGAPVSASGIPSKVYVSGEPVGIYIRTRGLLVLGTRTVEKGGSPDGPSANRLLAGDYIVKANGQKLNSRKALLTFLSDNKHREITFTIIRKGKEQDIAIKPSYSEARKAWQIGALVRSDTQGIGTITFICPDGRFTALGHGINDYDLGVSMDIAGGSIYRADISSVVKGEKKCPGEIVGSICYVSKNYLGQIWQNSKTGISGKLKNPGSFIRREDLLDVAAANEVKKGKAYLRTSISGVSKNYAIEIENINKKRKDRQKILKIHVTDSELLSLTGGIIQGLSGSPIIQDGKLIGAVTHVLVNDPTRGYGILASDMPAE